MEGFVLGTFLLIVALLVGVFLTVMGVASLAVIWKRDEKETFSSLLVWSAITSVGIVITYCALRGLGG